MSENSEESQQTTVPNKESIINFLNERIKISTLTYGDLYRILLLSREYCKYKEIPISIDILDTVSILYHCLTVDTFCRNPFVKNKLSKVYRISELNRDIYIKFRNKIYFEIEIFLADLIDIFLQHDVSLIKMITDSNECDSLRNKFKISELHLANDHFNEFKLKISTLCEE